MRTRPPLGPRAVARLPSIIRFDILFPYCVGKLDGGASLVALAIYGDCSDDCYGHGTTEVNTAGSLVETNERPVAVGTSYETDADGVPGSVTDVVTSYGVPPTTTRPVIVALVGSIGSLPSTVYCTVTVSP